MKSAIYNVAVILLLYENRSAPGGLIVSDPGNSVTGNGSVGTNGRLTVGKTAIQEWNNSSANVKIQRLNSSR